MALTEADLNSIHEILSELTGKKAWAVTLGYGSFVTAEFGEPIPLGDGRVRGEWHLWVQVCAWRLQTQSEVLAASEDDREKLRTILSQLNDRSLRSFSVRGPAGEAALDFERGLELRLFPITSEQYEHWMVFTPSGNVLQVGPGTHWSYSSGGLPFSGPETGEK